MKSVDGTRIGRLDISQHYTTKDIHANLLYSPASTALPNVINDACKSGCFCRDSYLAEFQRIRFPVETNVMLPFSGN